MNYRILLDEHLPPWWAKAIAQRHAGLTIWHIGAPGAPQLRTADPVILEWIEAHDFILLTNNRHSMPIHLATHLGSGRHVPGILTINRGMTVIEIADELALIAGATSPDELRDKIRYMPLSG